MKIYFLIPIIFYFLSGFSLAQVNNIEFLKKNYQSFNYTSVITTAEKILRNNNIDEDTKIEIYTLKAASHFILNDQSNTRKSFIEILKLNDAFELNKTVYSPKLIKFFDEIKTEFIEVRNSKKTKTLEKPIKKQLNSIKSNTNLNQNWNSAIAKSIILPGWGHLSLEQNTKNWLLISASTISLGSMIYYIFDTNRKEKDYLIEINQDIVQQKYDDFNKSYKIRNMLIITYAAIWLYTQIDLLFVTTDLGSKNFSAASINTKSVYKKENIQLSFQFSF